jgi:hypothetical protein
LVSTAERLGLEHAAATTGPDIEALRNVGTESPSGRLVIDISRLRENRAANVDVNEVTILSPSVTSREVPPESGPELQSKNALKFPRLSVPLGRSSKSKRQLLFVTAIIAVVLLVGTALVFRSRNASSANAPVAIASPSPSVEPTPSPSPSPTPKLAAAKPKPTPKKKGGFVNKVKRIFTKPF